MATKNNKGGGAKKYGRNRAKCQRYRTRGIREKNKTRRRLKHLKRHPNDTMAQ